VIQGLDNVDQGVLVFHAGTKLADDGSIVTAGGRVLTVVASGSTLADARALAYDNASRIEFEGKMLRTDIALREL
jgi:phosphoribosylamine--glycine ligase